MKAIGVYKSLPITDPQSLVDIEIERPVPSRRDLLVQVKALSVNPVDTKVRASIHEGDNTPRILGWDAAGVVVQAGPECTQFKPGDEVYYAGSIQRAGCNSEFHVVDERIVGRKPRNLTFAEAAALPLTSITTWEGLFDRLEISEQPADNQGKTILVVGAAGGVGSILTQLAHWAGLTVIGTASRPETIAWTKKLGSTYTINHHQPWQPQLDKLAVGDIDYIFCLNSTATHWDAMVEAIAPQGKICSIVETDKPINLSALQHKSVTFVWEFMFTRSMYHTKDMERQQYLLNKLAGLIEEQKIKTTLTELLNVINAANLRKIHQKLEQGTAIGKLVAENFPAR
ncbi:NADPH:quinone reductase [Ktedonobacteria bacterium brp13]|nr:NADPH:quinone reductase [Ktedonobacteria bacterium brp13]